MKNKKEILRRYVKNLFGEIGIEKGCYYIDSYLNHEAVVEVINDGGGVCQIISAQSQTKLLEKL